jgi:hypothetical protein
MTMVLAQEAAASSGGGIIKKWSTWPQVGSVLVVLGLCTLMYRAIAVEYQEIESKEKKTNVQPSTERRSV